MSETKMYVEELNVIETAEEFLKAIKCTSEPKEIRSFEFYYKKHCEISYNLVTELGEIVAKIMRLPEHDVSKLDYFNSEYKFDRNVNLLDTLEIEK